MLQIKNVCVDETDYEDKEENETDGSILINDDYIEPVSLFDFFNVQVHTHHVHNAHEFHFSSTHHVGTKVCYLSNLFIII